jgi:isopentenyl-diphosphate Delta-isomerase
MAVEKVDLIDSKDRPVGVAPLRRCLEEGLLHRAVAVVVTRADGRILLQRRSRCDEWQPGRLTVSCSGHVRAGETYAQAARRELAEELGLKDSAKPLWKETLPALRDKKGMTELETVQVFGVRTGSAPTPDPVELAGVVWVTAAELEGRLGKRELTPDAKIIFRRYFGSRQAGGRARPSPSNP